MDFYILSNLKRNLVSKLFEALLGQGPLLQSAVSVWESVGQSNPPFEGGIQERVLVFVPSPPHATEHSDQSSQSAHA